MTRLVLYDHKILIFLLENIFFSEMYMAPLTDACNFPNVEMLTLTIKNIIKILDNNHFAFHNVLDDLHFEEVHLLQSHLYLFINMS